MKISHLIKRDTCVRLSMVSFGSPQKNFEVFKFIKSIEPFQEYFETEYIKLFNKYGTTTENGSHQVIGQENVSAYQKELELLLDVDVDDEIYIPNLTISDFDEEHCQYPNDKNLWMNANDIKSILTFLDQLKDELKNRKDD